MIVSPYGDIDFVFVKQCFYIGTQCYVSTGPGCIDIHGAVAGNHQPWCDRTIHGSQCAFQPFVPAGWRGKYVFGQERIQSVPSLPCFDMYLSRTFVKDICQGHLSRTFVKDSHKKQRITYCGDPTVKSCSVENTTVWTLPYEKSYHGSRSA